MIPVKGYSTFDPLKHCIVGQVNSPETVEESLKGVMYRTQEDLNNLVKTLESMDVVCYRPSVDNKTQRPPISPRDYFVVLGEQLFVGKVITGYKDIVKSMVATADLSRSGFINGDISTVMSPRTVLTWAENYLLFNDIEYSFKLSFLNRCDEMERSILQEYFQRSFGIDITDAKVVNVKE